MRKGITRIELTRIIKTGVTPSYLADLLEKTTHKYKDHIIWLEEHKYPFEVIVEVESGGLVKNTSWPNFDHAVIYLELNDDYVVHYKLVWSGK